MKYVSCSLTENSVFLESWQGHSHLGITMTTDVNWLSLKEYFLLCSYIREMGEDVKQKIGKGLQLLLEEITKVGFTFFDVLIN